MDEENIVKIAEQEYKGHKIIRTVNGWKIEETGEEFDSAINAHIYIDNGLKRTSESQRKAIRDYEKRNYRLNIVFPGGTKERIEALNLNKTNSAFIRDAVLSKLDELEKILK